MDRLTNIEKSATTLVRGAGRYGVYLTHLGIEVAGVADWLETQIPRFGNALRAMVDAAARELTRADEER